ncbi:MAG: N-acetylmuramoyl-L-alanine amidase [Clostridia bacterium]|nr:N-acetylmuramoyl-L-alanine amidase [Clostridia bacterium]
MEGNQQYRRPSGRTDPPERRQHPGAQRQSDRQPRRSKTERIREERKRRRDRTFTAVLITIGVIGLLVLMIGMGRGTAKTGEYIPANIEPQNAAEAAQTLDKAKFAVICIDPGYGFSERGLHTGVAEEKYDLDESTVALKFSLALTDKLTNDGYTVVLTHDTNDIPEDESRGYKLTAAERAAIANDEGASLLISVHTRDVSSKKEGMVISYREADGSAKLLAETLAASLDETLTYSETKFEPLSEEEAYNILTKTNAPSLLIDIANMSNENDADRLNDDGWYNESAAAMANGIKNYLKAAAADDTVGTNEE